MLCQMVCLIVRLEVHLLTIVISSASKIDDALSRGLRARLTNRMQRMLGPMNLKIQPHASHEQAGRLSWPSFACMQKPAVQVLLVSTADSFRCKTGDNPAHEGHESLAPGQSWHMHLRVCANTFRL